MLSQVYGKTTFTLQVADNIAKQGHKVIIFSIEQSRFELVSKALSRITHENKPGDARSHTKIMQNENIDQVTIKAIEEYSQTIAPNEIIEEGNFETNINTINDFIRDYIATTNEKPVIVLDYLQILTPSNPKLSEKQQVDYNVTTLKKISRNFNIPVIVISSFNRGNYSNKVAFEAFKESGGIEYTADTLFGMQYNIISENSAVDKDDIEDEKKKIPRQIQLVCLKNRSGRTSFKVNFEFNPVFNHFVELPKNKQPSND